MGEVLADVGIGECGYWRGVGEKNGMGGGEVYVADRVNKYM